MMSGCFGGVVTKKSIMSLNEEYFLTITLREAFIKKTIKHMEFSICFVVISCGSNSGNGSVGQSE